MASLELGGRLYEFAEQVARLLETELSSAKAQLDALDDETRWASGKPGEPQILPASAGPGLCDALVLFMKVPAGGRVPMHRHLGEEHVLLVQGRCQDQQGQKYGPGDELWMAPGTAHSFDVFEDSPDLIFLTALRGGIEVLES